MKFSQISAIVMTLIVSIGVVMWLASTVPQAVFDTPPKQSVTQDVEPYPTEDDVERTNPFDLTTEGPQPKAVLEEDSFNFGKMILGEKGSHSFKIQNTGEAPLLLAKGPVQCKCTISGLKQESVDPGGEAIIELEYEPKSLGEFGQGAVIWTNDPEKSEIHLRVEGKMIQALEIYPTNGWNLGSIPSNEPVALEGSIGIFADESFEITSIETSSDAVEMEAEATTEINPVDESTRHGYQLTGTYHPSQEAGPIQEKVTIHTTLEKQPVIEFEITGQRSGPIAIIGPGWSAGLQSLNLGRIPAGKEHSHRMTFMIEPAEEPIEFTEIVTDPTFVDAKVEAAKNAPDAARHRFTFLVTIPEDAPKGIWGKENPATVTMKTNHPKLQEVLVNLRMTIQ